MAKAISNEDLAKARQTPGIKVFTHPNKPVAEVPAIPAPKPATPTMDLNGLIEAIKNITLAPVVLQPPQVPMAYPKQQRVKSARAYNIKRDKVNRLTGASFDFTYEDVDD